MIEFDKNGNIQPSEIIPINEQEFKEIFVDNFSESETRTKIFNGFQRYLSDFKVQITPSFKNWCNGSFTTTKLNPNDIDLVNLVIFNEEINKKQKEIFKFLTQGGSKESYSVDGYFVPIYEESDPRYELTKNYVSYWRDWFGKDRLSRKKGIIELSFE